MRNKGLSPAIRCLNPGATFRISQCRCSDFTIIPDNSNPFIDMCKIKAC